MTLRINKLCGSNVYKDVIAYEVRGNELHIERPMSHIFIPIYVLNQEQPFKEVQDGE